MHTKKNKGGFTDPSKIKTSVVAVYKNTFKADCKEEKKSLTLKTQKWK